ncbi:SIR2 family NAD-dependent protein deacylase [Sorangium sp. So ce1151]|uniref:SIR2 family NAD-dependent protein deacylase n=1 Tax=Sorangium sp. So ce1151 TaxID=3133332 RepID=UPI003F60D6F5
MAVLTLEQAALPLRQAYQEGRLIPFLGAGFSAPLQLPMWRELTGWMGESLGFEPALFELHGLPPQLAGFFARERDGGLDSFIAELRARFHAREVDERRRGSLQHKALARRRFPTIYTTNFEHHIEEALRDAGKPVVALSTFDDFARCPAQGACHVIKFHGDLDRPETVVLTEAQYFSRLRLEAAPDQRLRADLLSNTFLFLGYSFSDVDIRYIWYRMEQMRIEGSPPGAQRAPSRRGYWATFGAGLIQPALLEDWHIDVIELDPNDKTKSVVDLLDALDG